MLKIGLVLIQTLIVTVIKVPEGRLVNPDICTVVEFGREYFKLLELIVDVFANTEP